MGNLPESVNEDKLRGIFKAYGEVCTYAVFLAHNVPCETRCINGMDRGILGSCFCLVS